MPIIVKTFFALFSIEIIIIYQVDMSISAEIA
jgi:hypothetical protein